MLPRDLNQGQRTSQMLIATSELHIRNFLKYFNCLFGNSCQTITTPWQKTSFPYFIWMAIPLFFTLMTDVNVISRLELKWKCFSCECACICQCLCGLLRLRSVALMLASLVKTRHKSLYSAYSVFIGDGFCHLVICNEPNGCLEATDTCLALLKRNWIMTMHWCSLFAVFNQNAKHVMPLYRTQRER